MTYEKTNNSLELKNLSNDELNVICNLFYNTWLDMADEIDRGKILFEKELYGHFDMYFVWYREAINEKNNRKMITEHEKFCYEFACKTMNEFVNDVKFDLIKYNKEEA